MELELTRKELDRDIKRCYRSLFNCFKGDRGDVNRVKGFVKMGLKVSDYEKKLGYMERCEDFGQGRLW